MQWIRITTDEQLETLLRPALESIGFNSCSGTGYRDKMNRLLVLVGQRDAETKRTENLIGVNFPEQPELQVAALDLIANIYAERHQGECIFMWLPRDFNPNQPAAPYKRPIRAGNDRPYKTPHHSKLR
jgi:hypothetical protein